MRTAPLAVAIIVLLGDSRVDADGSTVNLVKDGHAITVPAAQAGALMDEGYVIETADAAFEREGKEHRQAQADDRNRDMLIGGVVAVAIAGGVLLLRRKLARSA